MKKRTAMVMGVLVVVLGGGFVALQLADRRAPRSLRSWRRSRSRPRPTPRPHRRRCRIGRGRRRGTPTAA